MAAEASRPLRVAVTGGTGFIGYQLLRALRSQHLGEYTPVAIVRPTSNAVRLERLLDYPTPDETVLVADFNDAASLQRAVRNASIVVHLAAEMDFFPRDAGAAIAGNADVTRGIVAACKFESMRTGNRIRLVYVSSTEALGSTGPTPADETAAPRPDSAYGANKVLCESIVRDAAEAIDVVVLRPPGVYGVGENFFFRELLEMAESGLSIVAPSPCSGKIMFAHVHDVVSAIMLTLRAEAAVGQTYHVCPDEAVTFLQIIRTLNQACGRIGPICTMGVTAGKILIRAISPIMNFGRRRVFLYHPTSIERTMGNRVYSNSKIKTELGFKPVHEVLSGMRQVALEEIAQGGLHHERFSPLLYGLVTLASTVIFVAVRLQGRS